MKFSIIIPVFNVRKYIRKCIASVLEQSFQDYEIILVDDGSTDGSSLICDEYTSNKKIKCIHQHNQGLSMARNNGVNNAHGEYILFLDSDDYYVGKNALAKVAEYADGCDIVVFGWQEFSEKNGNITTKNSVGVQTLKKTCYGSGEEFLAEVLKRVRPYTWYSCMRCYRRHFWLNYNFQFPRGLKYEDAYLMPRVLLKAKKICITNEVIYGYRIDREGSITGSITLKGTLDKLTVIKENFDYLENLSEINIQVKALILDSIACLYYSVITDSNWLESSEKKALIDKMQELKWVCKYSLYNPQKALAKIIGILGVNATAKILGIRRKLKYNI